MKYEILGTCFFAAALLHTFSVSYFAKLSHRFEKGSAREAFFYLLSEVEVVFGFWAFLFLTVWACLEGITPVVQYQQSLNMTEPLFIFCIMIMASTRPVIAIARRLILALSLLLGRVLGIPTATLQFLTLMIVGPLLGSFITEPAAITITALLLYRMIDEAKVKSSFLYGILGLLFVNISVGGALTHFAAPPILVVARTWGWGFSDVFSHLGVAALLSVVVNAGVISYFYRREIQDTLVAIEKESYRMPIWVTITHLIFMALLVASSHYPQVFVGLFLIFMGLVSVTKNFQDQLKFREAFLVAFFLSGLIVFGAFQKWWLEPLLTSLDQYTLYFGAIVLTAVTDNAALTYLGSQVPGLSELAKWALVAGSLVGGGLTILANAPNPAGFSILSSKFPEGSLNAFKLFRAALFPTSVALLIFFAAIFLF